MLAVLSPAKTLDFTTPLRLRRHTVPEFLAETATLVEVMRGQDAPALRALVGISEELAALNVARFRDWADDPTTGGRQALFAFMGDVYQGLAARTLDSRAVTRAQRRLRILSGLYGLLRPLDLIQPHRLEMGTALATPHGANLYRHWGARPTHALNAALTALRTRWLLNLASVEYFRAVDTAILDADVITPRFLDWSRGDYRVVSFHAKRARGLMARYLLTAQPRTPDDLRAFDAAGYRYDAQRSRPDSPAFVRRGT